MNCLHGNRLFRGVSGLSIVQADLLDGEISWLLSGRLGDEPSKSCGVLCVLVGLHLGPPPLLIVFCNKIC